MRQWMQRLVLVGLALHLSGCAALVASGAAAGAFLAHDRRSTGTIVEDHSIELKVYKIIAQLDTREDSHLSAISYNNNLLLLGQTLTEDVRTQLEEQVRKISKVNKVYNEINLLPPTSLITRSSDAWITTKIKAELLLSKRVDPTRFKVTTEDGVVYLLGLIRSDEEASAVDVARRVKGVRKVVKLFEYLDLPAAPHSAHSLLPQFS